MTLDGSSSLFATVPIYRMDRDGGRIEWFAGSGEVSVAAGPARQAGLARANGIAAAADGSALFLNTLEYSI